MYLTHLFLKLTNKAHSARVRADGSPVLWDKCCWGAGRGGWDCRSGLFGWGGLCEKGKSRPKKKKVENQ